MWTKQDLEKVFIKYKPQAEKLLQNTDKVKHLLQQAIDKAKKNDGIIGESVRNLELTFDMFRDWLKGDYRDVPTRSLVTIVVTLLYFVSVVDFIPDFLIGIGLVDDAAVIAYAVKQIQKDLDKYKLWKHEKNRLEHMTIDME
ncbi:YkvA family protein [Bacillus songklensis]|uniref:YkvA family protein n=1 Tax=Bacillus songklensis TaxID=1069116 RepID=A0ABV8B2B4_9BACI